MLPGEGGREGGRESREDRERRGRRERGVGRWVQCQQVGLTLQPSTLHSGQHEVAKGPHIS